MRALVALFVLLALAGAAGAARQKAALKLASRTPVTIQGSGFPARLAVHVTATADGTRTATVRASRAGTFVLRFQGLLLGRCSGLVVRAQAGTTVALLKLPRPACLPERQPG